jgi:hypothetical protein
MILSYRDSGPQVPISSSCIIKTKGILRDGDIISVTSPLFSSVDYSSGAINTSETFDVKFSTSKSEGVNNEHGDMIGTLICTDNDLFNLYVRETI